MAGHEDKEVQGKGQRYSASSATGAHKDRGHPFFNATRCKRTDRSFVQVQTVSG